MNAHAYDNMSPSYTKRINFFTPTSTYPAVRYRAASDYVDEFNGLADRWEADTLSQSSIREKMAHPSFVAMTAMGEKILPLAIGRLKQKPSFLFLVAHKVSGVNPVSEGSQGKVVQICEAWIRWAERTRVDVNY